MAFKCLQGRNKHILYLIFRYINTCFSQEPSEGQESDVYQANPVCAGGACVHSWRSDVSVCLSVCVRMFVSLYQCDRERGMVCFAVILTNIIYDHREGEPESYGSEHSVR